MWEGLQAIIGGMWSELTLTQTVLWGLAIASSLGFVVMLLMSIAGFDFDSEGDGGGEGGFFAFLTLRNILAFLVGFSWTGLMLLDQGWSVVPSLGVGAFVGFVLALVVVLFMQMFARLSSSGNIELQNAVGAEGSVSINVPGNRHGHGKVSLSLQGRLVEMEAITDSPSELRRHTRVKVAALSGHQLIVQPIG